MARAGPLYRRFPRGQEFPESTPTLLSHSFQSTTCLAGSLSIEGDSAEPTSLGLIHFRDANFASQLFCTKASEDHIVQTTHLREYTSLTPARERFFINQAPWVLGSWITIVFPEVCLPSGPYKSILLWTKVTPSADPEIHPFRLRLGI